MSVYQRKSKFDDYIMQDYLGSGSSAEVWKVTDTQGDVLALKIFAPGSGLDDFGRTVFREEFEKTFDLHHPNILQALRYGDYDDKPFITMPLSEEGSLMRELRRRMFARKNEGQLFENLFSEFELAVIIHQLANALVYLQDHGIVHRDVKPDNMLIFRDGTEARYVLTDFGISSRIRRTIQRQTRAQINTDSGMTPAYAAPELFRGQIHALSDVFSLGISIYELACGETPVVMSGVGIGLAMINGAVIEPLPGDYSSRFRAVLDMCLKESTDERCSPHDLMAWTHHFLTQGGWPAIERAPQVSDAAPHNPEYAAASLTEEDTEFMHFMHKYSEQSAAAVSAAPTKNEPASSPVWDAPLQGTDTPTPASATFPQASPQTSPNSSTLTPKYRAKTGVWILGTLAIGLAMFFGLSAYLQERAYVQAQSAWQKGQLGLASLGFAQLCQRTGKSTFCHMDSLLREIGSRYEMTPFLCDRSRIRCLERGLYGFMDLRGEIVIEPQFIDAGGYNQYGFVWVAEDLPEGRRFGLIDTTGRVVLPIRHSQMIIEEDKIVISQDEVYSFEQLKSK